MKSIETSVSVIKGDTTEKLQSDGRVVYTSETGTPTKKTSVVDKMAIAFERTSQKWRMHSSLCGRERIDMLLKRIKYLLWLWKVGRKKFPMKPLIDTTHDSVIDKVLLYGREKGVRCKTYSGSGGETPTYYNNGLFIR